MGGFSIIFLFFCLILVTAILGAVLWTLIAVVEISLLISGISICIYSAVVKIINNHFKTAKYYKFIKNISTTTLVLGIVLLSLPLSIHLGYYLKNVQYKKLENKIPMPDVNADHSYYIYNDKVLVKFNDFIINHDVLNTLKIKTEAHFVEERYFNDNIVSEKYIKKLFKIENKSDLDMFMITGLDEGWKNQENYLWIYRDDFEKLCSYYDNEGNHKTKLNYIGKFSDLYKISTQNQNDKPDIKNYDTIESYTLDFSLGNYCKIYSNFNIEEEHSLNVEAITSYDEYDIDMYNLQFMTADSFLLGNLYLDFCVDSDGSLDDNTEKEVLKTIDSIGPYNSYMIFKSINDINQLNCMMEITKTIGNTSFNAGFTKNEEQNKKLIRAIFEGQNE